MNDDKEEEAFNKFQEYMDLSRADKTDFNFFTQNFRTSESKKSILRILFKCLFAKNRYDTVDEIIKEFNVFQQNV